MSTIAEDLQRLVIAKNDIAEAITNKGVIVTDTDGFEEYADLIKNIKTGDSPFSEYDVYRLASYNNYVSFSTYLTPNYYGTADWNTDNEYTMEHSRIYFDSNLEHGKIEINAKHGYAGLSSSSSNRNYLTSTTAVIATSPIPFKYSASSIMYIPVTNENGNNWRDQISISAGSSNIILSRTVSVGYSSSIAMPSNTYISYNIFF